MSNGVAVLILCVLCVVVGSYTFLDGSNGVNSSTVGFFDQLLKWLNHWGVS